MGPKRAVASGMWRRTSELFIKSMMAALSTSLNLLKTTFIELLTQDRQICSPGSHSLAILLRHHSYDLPNVVEIMYHPCSQQLPQRYHAQLRMFTPGIEQF